MSFETKVMKFKLDKMTGEQFINLLKYCQTQVSEVSELEDWLRLNQIKDKPNFQDFLKGAISLLAMVNYLKEKGIKCAMDGSRSLRDIYVRIDDLEAFEISVKQIIDDLLSLEIEDWLSSKLLKPTAKMDFYDSLEWAKQETQKLINAKKGKKK